MSKFTLDGRSVGIRIVTDGRPKSIDDGLDFLLRNLFKVGSGPVRLSENGVSLKRLIKL